MNAFMNIQVRIITARAQAQIRQLKGELARLDQGLSQGAKGARGMEGGFARAMTAGTKFGNQLQWTGRQLQYNFAMPIALATGLAVKFALENEAAMVRVQKVYGDAGQDVSDFGGEVKALERNFRALSNHFGVHRSEVIKIAGDWAAAGATGVALAKATRLTLETMILGEMGAVEATQSLLAVQGQYNLSVQELSQAMDTLNQIENETDVSMNQLITSMARSAGTARQAGVDIQHLAAMTAALVPEAGAASNAGNGLKTIISRMLAPTEDAALVLGKMGLSMEDLDWQSLNVTQRLQKLADEFVKLPEGQRAVVGEYVAGRYQITRFNQALTDIADRNGDYHKAVNASADATQNYRQRVRELNAVLGSNPQKMKQVKVILENTLADAIVPLIPAIVFFAQKIAQVAQAFANLDPGVQMLIGSLLLFLALFGPMLRYLGSSITLFATLGGGIKYLARPLSLLKGMFFGTSAAAATSAASMAASNAKGNAAMVGNTTATAGRMSSLWAATHAAMFKVAKAGWLGQAAAQAAYSGVSTGQTAGFFMSQAAQTGTHHAKTNAMWTAFWAKRKAQNASAYTTQQAQAAGAIAAETSAFQMGYTARTQAAATALGIENKIRVGHYTKTYSQEVALRTTLQGLWAQYWMRHIAETVARGQQWVVLQLEMGAEGAAAQQRAAAMMRFIWSTYWTQHVLAAVAAQQAWVVPQLEAGAAATGSAVATTNAMRMTWSTFWTQWILSAVAANQKWVVLELESGAKVTGARLATYSTLTVMTAEAYAAMAAAQYSATAAMLAGEQAFGVKLIGQRTIFQTALTAGTASSSAAQVAIRETALATEAAAETAQQATRRARFAGFWASMTLSHQAFMLKLAAIGQVGFGRLGALETAHLTASRARWSAYFIQLSVMQRGAAAKMVATDAAMKAKMGGAGLIAFLLRPWSIAFLAILGLAYVFRDDIARIFGQVREWIAAQMKPLGDFFGNLSARIVDAFYQLPRGVQNAMLAVVRVVHAAAMKVYELFSYLNPFARHSPSLVENVTAGSAIVAKQYHRMGTSVAASLAAARRHLAAFKNAAGALGIDEWSDKRIEIGKGLPQMLPLFNTLVADLGKLNVILANQERAMNAQEEVVKKWKTALDEANTAVDVQQNKLEGLRTTLQALEDQYTSHEQAMQDYASAPIQGMGEMSDKIFENELAQKKLRLEIMDWEDANGSIDDVRDRLSMLQGDIENARAEASDLRSAGAGSDILGPIEAEIAAMEAQADATRKAVENSPVNELEKQLEQLERAGERLNLENAIQFDPMLREIDKLANGMKELPYDEIIAGINREREAMAALEPQIDAATKAVEAQEAAVDRLTAARDVIQATYDAESAKLDVLQAQYAETADVIRDIEQALNDVGSAARDVNERAAKAARDALGPDQKYAGEKFDMAAGADFADVGGSGNVPREFPEIGDQSKLIDEMTRQLTEETNKAFGEFDMLGPIKRAWKRVTDWWATSAWPALDPVLGELGRKIRGAWESMFDGEGFEIGPVWDRIEEKMRAGGEKLRGAIGFIAGIVTTAWGLIGQDIADIFSRAWDSIKRAFGDIGREVAAFGGLWEPLKETMSILWSGLLGAIIVFAGAVMGALKVAFSVLSETIQPILDTISDTIENALQIIRGVLQVIMGAINGDWQLAWDGIKNIVQGTADGIWDILDGLARTLAGAVEGVVKAVADMVKEFAKANPILAGIVGAISLIFIPALVRMATSAAVNAAIVVVNFGLIAAAAVKSAITTAAQIAIQIGRWVALQVAAALNAAKVVAAWVVASAGAIASGVVMVAQVALQVGRWAFLATQAMISAVRIAAAWVVAMGPIGWIGLAIAALVALVIIYWDDIKRVIVNTSKSMWEAVKPHFNSFLRGVANVWNAVGETIARGVNIGIDAINGLIGAINWVGKNVPGLNFSVSTLGKVTWQKWSPPQFATGGVLPTNVGEGFVTNKARAIVGEGGPSPEYVIPTDPRYRANALRLYGDLGKQLDVQPVGGFGFDIPGVDIAGAIQSAGSALRKGAVSAALAGPMKLFNAIAEKLPNRPVPIKDFIMEAKKNIQNWASGIEGKMPAAAMAGEMGSDPVSGSGWSAIENYLRTNGNVARVITSTLRPGDRGHHGRGMAIDYSSAGHGNRGFDHKGLRDIFNALLPIGGNLSELILAGAPFNIKNGRKVPGYAWGQPGKPGNHWNHVHAAIKAGATARQGGVQEFANGGIANKATLGVFGEAGSEVLSPLAPLWARFDSLDRKVEAQQVRGGGDTIININGNLEFPNISDGSDADEFVRNLTVMARR